MKEKIEKALVILIFLFFAAAAIWTYGCGTDDQIILPQTSTLKWECQYCDSAYINQGIGDVDCAGSQKVRPEKTTAYTLTAYGLDGNRMFQAIVNIGFVPILREVLPR